MKARIQVGLVKLSDPRVARALLIGLMVALALLGTGSATFACTPGGAGGGCSGT
jgi:hypothetical protein